MEDIPATAGPNRITLHPESVALLRKRASSGQRYYWELGVAGSRKAYDEGVRLFRPTCPFSGKITNHRVTSKLQAGINFCKIIK